MATKLNFIPEINQKKRNATLSYQFDELCGSIGIVHETPLDKEKCGRHVHKALEELAQAYQNCGGNPDVGWYLSSGIRHCIVDIMTTLEILQGD